MAQAYHAMASKEFGVGKTEVSFSLTIAWANVRFRGVKRTSKFKSVTSAFDPKRSSTAQFLL